MIHDSKSSWQLVSLRATRSVSKGVFRVLGFGLTRDLKLETVVFE